MVTINCDNTHDIDDITDDSDDNTDDSDDDQEYERAVIFRLGRLLTGGARGPGVFFIIPCVDVFEKIDMRTMTYEIPPQEVISVITIFPIALWHLYLANHLVVK